MAYHLTQEGREVQIDLNKIEDIELATEEKAGLMSPTDKAKINSVGQGAQPNVIERITVNGTEQSVSEKTVNLLIPTLVSQLVNDSGFVVKTVDDLVNYYKKTETYNRAEIAALIGAIQKFHYEIYASIEDVTRPATNVLYLIGPTGTGTDKYEEYVYDPSKQDPFVKIGDTSIDLSNYVTTEALNTALADYTTTANLTTLLAGKQDKIDADHKLSYTLLTDTPTIPDAQIQSDWNQSDDTKKDFIKNKPTIPTVTGKADKVTGATNGNFAALDSNGNLTDSGKKASDFATSAQGGKADTAYQLPSGGIPKTDLASAVQTSLGLADTAVQPEAGKGLFSGDYNDLSNKPTIPTVPTIDTSIDNASSNSDTAGAKAVYDAVHPATGSSQPAGGMLPNVLYKLGTLTGSVTFSLATPADANIANHYYWTFDAGSTAPTITWPTGITWAGGSAPAISANKHYEISVLDNYGIYVEV